MDPDFAPAYARLADAYSLMAIYWYEDLDTAYTKAREYALKAIWKHGLSMSNAPTKFMSRY